MSCAHCGQRSGVAMGEEYEIGDGFWACLWAYSDGPTLELMHGAHGFECVMGVRVSYCPWCGRKLGETEER